jgi:creatinine amidohydrolase
MTGEQEEIRYELMRPTEVIRRREACPLAYLPLGPIEWHGLQNPMGLDGIKAHELCLRAARKGGGLVFPVVWYGEHRESHLAEANRPASPSIAEAMKLPKASFDEGYMGERTVGQQAQLFLDLVFHILYQLKSLGFQAIYLVAGHGPLLPYLTLTGNLFERRTGVKVATEHTGAMVDGFTEGHGGRLETGVIMTTRPELVDLNQLPEGDSTQIVGVAGQDPRKESQQTGDAFVPLCIEHMVKQAKILLDRDPSDGRLTIE